MSVGCINNPERERESHAFPVKIVFGGPGQDQLIRC